MGPVEVVIGEPGRHGGGALGRGLEWLGVDPLAQAGLDEAFRLTVGAWGVRPGAFVLDPPPAG